jgi:hypothetical protein
MTIRVIQWGTGNVGRISLRAILDRPDLELAAVVVSDPAKDGVDVGTLCGREPVGMVATTDVDAALALDAQVVAYHAVGERRERQAASDMARALRAGKDVVSTTVVSLVFPAAAPADMVEELQAACQAGGSSCFTSGIDPGFANDLLPLTLTGFCQRVDAVRAIEIMNYSTYAQVFNMRRLMGFGEALDYDAPFFRPGIPTWAWGASVHALAAGLGLELERIEESTERAPAPETLDSAVGPIEAGTTAGIRFELRGIVDGQPRVVVEHANRMRDDVAPDWPTIAGGNGYRIVIEGEPSYQCDLQLATPSGDPVEAALIATAMRTVNAIPAVHAARPGLLTALDLPLVTGRGLVGAATGARVGE